MRDVFQLERGTQIPEDDGQVDTYPYLLSYFRGKETYSARDLVLGAHMVYGWNPRKLRLYQVAPDEIALKEAANLLTIAKRYGSLDKEALQDLSWLIDNSLVSVSKLLHFVAPRRFAIWDSRVFRFVFGEKPNGRTKGVDVYYDYLGLLGCLRTDQRFPRFHRSVEEKVGYRISPLRSLELVMYLRGGDE